MTWLVEYWKENLTRSFGVWEKHEALSVLARMVLAAIPSLGVAASADTSVGTKVGIGLALWFGVIMFVFTPMGMWKTLRDRLAPRVSAEGSIRVSGKMKTACITVKNNGARITGCIGRLERVYAVVDGKMELVREVQPVRLQWSSRDGGGQSTDIDKEADLDVVFMDCSGDEHFTIVAFNPELRHLYRLPERPTYVFIISIGADKLVPVQYECKLAIGRLPPGGLRDLSFDAMSFTQTGSQVS